MAVADAGSSPASQSELHALAFTDPLTGLGNRYRLRDKIRQLITERAADPAPFAIGIANLDGFKPINDLFGPSSGDQILCQVAHRLKACIPDGATVVRYDGDEFAFLLPLVFERRSAEKIGAMLKEVLSAPYDLGDRNVRLSASFGFAIHPFAGDEFEELIKSAETALYRSKRRGRGQITVYSTEIAEQMKRATQLEQALRNAIIANEVDVHFQPIVNLQNDTVVGFEALARWIDKDLVAGGFRAARRRTRLHRCAFGNVAAQGGRCGAVLAEGAVFIVQSVVGAADGPVDGVQHPGRDQPHRSRSPTAGAGDHRNSDDDRSGDGAEDRLGTACRRRAHCA